MRVYSLITDSSALALFSIGSLVVLGCDFGISRSTPPPDLYEIPEGEGRLAATAQTFRHYDSIAKVITSCHSIELYEGLPHQSNEQELYDRELQESETVELNGWPFYVDPIQLSERHAGRLKEIFCDRSYFVPFQGFKACGGYHPDWCIVWSSEDEEYLVQFCFGCDEMKATDGEVEVYCDVWDIREIKRILNKYRRKRPQT